MLHLVDWVLHKLGERLGVKVLVLVVRNIRLLVEDVVKAGSPFPAAQTSCVAAVVHHERHPTSMHVWVERVNSLQYIGRNMLSSQAVVLILCKTLKPTQSQC